MRTTHLDPILLPVPEAGALLSLGKTTVWGLIQSGVLPTVRVGRSVRVPRVALEEYVARLQAEQRTVSEYLSVDQAAHVLQCSDENEALRVRLAAAAQARDADNARIIELAEQLERERTKTLADHNHCKWRDLYDECRQWGVEQKERADTATQARDAAERVLAEIHEICRMGLEGCDALEERDAIQALTKPYREAHHAP